MGKSLSLFSATDPDKCQEIMLSALAEIKNEIRAAKQPHTDPEEMKLLGAKVAATIESWEVFANSVEILLDMGVSEGDKMDALIVDAMVEIKEKLTGLGLNRVRQEGQVKEQVGNGKGKEILSGPSSARKI